MLIRAFATSTLRVALLHLLLLTVCSGLLWQQLPRLLPSVGNWLLEGSGVTLVTLVMQPQMYPPYLIDEIKLQTDSHSLQAREIDLQQLATWQHQWRVNIAQLQITAVDPVAATVDILQPSVGSAWQSLTTSLAQFTQQGDIEHIEYCAGGCLVGAISWQRNADQLVLNATEFGYGAQLAIHAVEDKVAVSMVVDTTRANAGPTRLGETLGQHLPERLSLEVQLQKSDSGELDMQGDLILGAKRQLLSLTDEPATTVHVDLDTTLSRIGFAIALPSDNPLQLTAIQQAADYRLNATINANWRIEQGDTAVTGNSPLAFTLVGQRGDIDLQLNRSVSAQVVYPDLTDTELNLAPDTRCHIPLGDSPYTDSSLDEDALVCQVPSASLKGKYNRTWQVDTEFTDSRVKSAAGNWSVTSKARVLVNDEQQRVLTMDSQLLIANNQVQLSSDNARAYQLALQTLALKHDLKRGLGELHIALDTTLSETLKLPPLQTLPRLQAVRGRLIGTTRVAWLEQRQSLAQLEVESRYQLDNVDFDYDDYQFSGVNLQLALNGWPHMVSPTDATLQIAQLNVGLPVADIKARFAIDLNADSGSAMLTGQALSLNLLGGTASSQQWSLNPVTQSGFVQLALQDLALQQILALERDDFDSSGRIYGSVPIHVEDGTIDIQQGQLDAIAPGGYIRYQPDDATRAMLLQSGKTKIVLETLADFQYDNLAVLLSYSPAGNLIANTALRGRNPAFENGREIRFNLSIEQNLGTLLKSLRMSEDVEKKVQNRSQKRQSLLPANEVETQ